MLGGADSPPEDVLEDMAYLSRSDTRIRVLNVLTAAPHTLREISEMTDIPRSTIQRTLSEIVDRGWVERTTDGEYTLTGIGEHVAAETDQYLGAMQAIRALGEAVAWLPSNELTIGIQHFKEATVRRPNPDALNAPSTYATKLLQEASAFACLVNTAPSLAFEKAMVNGVIDGRLTTNHIITERELSVLRQDVERASRWQAYIEAGAELYCYDGPIPCNLLIIDETVFILDQDPKAVEGIESTNAMVRSWAHKLIDDYRAAAKRLDTTAFSQ